MIDSTLDMHIRGDSGKNLPAVSQHQLSSSWLFSQSQTFCDSRGLTLRTSGIQQQSTNTKSFKCACQDYEQF